MSGLIGAGLFIAGCIIGAIFHKLFSSNRGTASQLSKNLDSVSGELADYQDQVDAHFKRTAELVQSMTQSYADVHHELARGAQVLSRASLPPLNGAKPQEKLTPPASEAMHAPRDYPTSEEADNDKRKPEETENS